MTYELWHQVWIEHYLSHANLVTKDNPLMLGWCVYIEVFELD